MQELRDLQDLTIQDVEPNRGMCLNQRAWLTEGGERERDRDREREQERGFAKERERVREIARE